VARVIIAREHKTVADLPARDVTAAARCFGLLSANSEDRQVCPLLPDRTVNEGDSRSLMDITNGRQPGHAQLDPLRETAF
jgi:hypothetical protein